MFEVIEACEFGVIGFRVHDQVSKVDLREMIWGLQPMEASDAGDRSLPQHR